MTLQLRHDIHTAVIFNFVIVPKRLQITRIDQKVIKTNRNTTESEKSIEG